MLVEANEQKEKENLQLKKTRFVRNFIRNDFKSREEVLQAAQKASIEIENTMYLAVLLGERSDSNESRAHAMMLDVIAQAAHLDGYGIHLVSNNQSLFVLFSDSAERIEETLGMLFTIGKECHGEFVMSVSNYHRISWKVQRPIWRRIPHLTTVSCRIITKSSVLATWR